jgi:hypothetical protein
VDEREERPSKKDSEMRFSSADEIEEISSKKDSEMSCCRFPKESLGRFEGKGRDDVSINPWSLLLLLIEMRSVHGMERFRPEEEFMVIRCWFGEVWMAESEEIEMEDKWKLFLPKFQSDESFPFLDDPKLRRLPGNQRTRLTKQKTDYLNEFFWNLKTN